MFEQTVAGFGKLIEKQRSANLNIPGALIVDSGAWSWFLTGCLLDDHAF